MCHCGLNASKRIWKHALTTPFLEKLLACVSCERRGVATVGCCAFLSTIKIPTYTETGKYLLKFGAHSIV